MQHRQAVHVGKKRKEKVGERSVKEMHNVYIITSVYTCRIIIIIIIISSNIALSYDINPCYFHALVTVNCAQFVIVGSNCPYSGLTFSYGLSKTLEVSTVASVIFSNGTWTS